MTSRRLPRRTLKSKEYQLEHWSTTLGYTKAIHSSYNNMVIIGGGCKTGVSGLNGLGKNGEGTNRI